MRYVMVTAVSIFLASCGGGDAGCKPPCTGSLVCCDFESGRKCVDPEQCK